MRTPSLRGSPKNLRRPEASRRASELRRYCVYLLLCDDGSYYTGYTSDLATRFDRHKKGQGARYTKMRRARRIVYVERYRTRLAAMRRERRMKLLTHGQKQELASKAAGTPSKKATTD